MPERLAQMHENGDRQHEVVLFWSGERTIIVPVFELH